MLLAETMPNVLFFSLSRTPEREDKFIWLGEVSPYGQNFYQLSTRPKRSKPTRSRICVIAIYGSAFRTVPIYFPT